MNRVRVRFCPHLCRYKLRQLACDALDHATPVPWLHLTVESSRRIPRGIRELGMPSPVVAGRQHEPQRLAESAREVGGGSVDGDHEVKLSNQRGGGSNPSSWSLGRIVRAMVARKRAISSGV